MDGTFEQRRSLNENGKRKDTYTQNKNETAEMFGHIFKKRGLAILTPT